MKKYKYIKLYLRSFSVFFFLNSLSRSQSDKVLLSPFQWEATVLPWAHGAPRVPQYNLLLPAHLFSLARPATSCLLGSLGPTTGAVLVPFPYTAFPNFCKDPAHSEQYHLALQVLGHVLKSGHILCCFCCCDQAHDETAPAGTLKHEV